jgi:hypothetical protein
MEAAAGFLGTAAFFGAVKKAVQAKKSDRGLDCMKIFY